MMQLGALQSAAAQRGDDRAADVLGQVAELLSSLHQSAERDERRRASDRGRQDKHRRKDGHVTSRDVTLHHVSHVTPSPLFPPSRALPSLSPHPDDDNNSRDARSVSHRDARDAEQDELTERYAAMLHAAMGDELFRSADEFVKRRPYATWLGWFREMLALIGPGSQFVASDLAQVCRDDAALDRPIGTPKGLRSFLASVRAERVAPKEPAVPVRSNGNGKAAAAPSRGVVMYGKIRDLIRTTTPPGQAPHRMIPKVEVGQLGPDVLRAYEQVGGAERFLNVAPSDVSFLIRDFTQALEGRQHGAA